MNDEQREALGRACVILGESISRAFEAATAIIALFAENITDIVDDVVDHYGVNDKDELLQLLEKTKEQYLADFADDLSEIAPIKPKLPRPPKRIRSVNKVNYTYNRPQRRARSNCHVIKRYKKERVLPRSFLYFSPVR